MIVMPANHSSPVIHYLAGKHPGKLGWLVGPTAASKTKLREWMPYALDNDAFSAWTKQKEWDVGAWRSLLQWAEESGLIPRWALVPDVVADKEGTLKKWDRHAWEVDSYGFDLAFAVQDGMTSEDVPEEAKVVFVGGSTEWKWATVERWTKDFPRVHVGRVNTIPRLDLCVRYKAESVDGTGWFRDGSDDGKIPALIRWLEKQRVAEEVL